MTTHPDRLESWGGRSRRAPGRWIASALVGLLCGLSSVVAADVPITDGGFENGAPPLSLWSESTNTPTDCPTSIGDWSGFWILPAAEGSFDYWAGGFCSGPTDSKPIQGTVGRLVTVPAAVPILKFRYVSYRVDADDAPGDDVVRMRMNGGTEVWTFDASQATANTFDGVNGGFVEAEVDLCAWAGTESLLSISLTPGAGNNVANVRFDDFRWADAIFVSGFECALGRWSTFAD